MLRADRAQRVDDAGVAAVSPDPRSDRIVVGMPREHTVEAREDLLVRPRHHDFGLVRGAAVVARVGPLGKNLPRPARMADDPGSLPGKAMRCHLQDIEPVRHRIPRRLKRIALQPLSKPPEGRAVLNFQGGPYTQACTKWTSCAGYAVRSSRRSWIRFSSRVKVGR
jgi:hypothetical protein